MLLNKSYYLNFSIMNIFFKKHFIKIGNNLFLDIHIDTTVIVQAISRFTHSGTVVSSLTNVRDNRPNFKLSWIVEIFKWQLSLTFTRMSIYGEEGFRFDQFINGANLGESRLNYTMIFFYFYFTFSNLI